MPRKISFINYKGGVGKTSLIVNVAAALAQEGNRVLLVDLDVQSNSSIWLLRIARWNKLVESKSGYLYTIFEPGTARIRDCICKDVVYSPEGADVALPGLDLLPTTFSLIDLEESYESKDGRPPCVRFQEQLAEVEDDYDYILFDCPPNILKGSACGIYASHEIYVPCNPDALSLIGFTLLVEKLDKFYDTVEMYRADSVGPFAEIRGAIFNSIKANSNVIPAKMRTQVRINQLKGKGIVAADMKIFNAQVRDEVIVPRAVTLGLPVCLIGTTKKEGSVRDDYRAVAKEIVSHARKDMDAEHVLVEA